MATLIEALKSGRRFRRDSTCFWFEVSDWSTDARGIHFDVSDILSNEWIIEEPKKKPREWDILLNTESGNILPFSLAKSLNIAIAYEQIKVREVLEEEGLY